MEVKKTYKIRLYPNKEQEAELLRVLNGCRYIWNYFLADRKNFYLKNKQTKSYAVMARELTQLRKGTEWLSVVNSEALQQQLRILDRAYNRFFRKLAKLPKFKSKKDTSQSFIARWYRIDGNKIQIYRGLSVKFRGTPPLNPVDFCSATIKLENGKWYANMVVLEKVVLPKKYKAPIGIDLGLNQLAITSNGKKYDNPKPRKKLQKRIKLLSQSLAKKVKGSNRRQKAKLELVRVHERIRNQRLDYLHKISSSIVSENQALIAIEDLSVANMMKNHKLAGSFADTGIKNFITMLEYKQLWKGGLFVKIGKFFPSSKTCHKCQYVAESMPLTRREWQCLNCKTKHDRDINAAKVILQQGLALSPRRELRKVAL